MISSCFQPHFCWLFPDPDGCRSATDVVVIRQVRRQRRRRHFDRAAAAGDDVRRRRAVQDEAWLARPQRRRWRDEVTAISRITSPVNARGPLPKWPGFDPSICQIQMNFSLLWNKVVVGRSQSWWLIDLACPDCGKNPCWNIYDLFKNKVCEQKNCKGSQICTWVPEVSSMHLPII